MNWTTPLGDPIGAPLPDWRPPPRPPHEPLEGRYARLEPLAAGHAEELHDANSRDAAKFLRERGACPHLGGIRIAEAVLCDGDSVEVEGSAVLEMTALGYRDSGYRMVLEDRPGSPLVIRAVS